jgi:glycosyltransferase involved in cell wall biosynthesis
MVESLGDDFEVSIVTSDRDLGHTQPYPGIEPGVWQRAGKCRVLYLPPAEFGLAAWRRHLIALDHDLIYLNGFFSLLTIRTLLLRRVRKIPPRPVVLAPRGELALGALSLKKLKKHAYIDLARYLGLYRGITWQATSEQERQDVVSVFGNDIRGEISWVRVSPNLPTRSHVERGVSPGSAKEPGAARIVFLARLARHKNLDFAIRLLGRARGRVQFDVYGPIEDESYWRECQELTKYLPPSVQACYRSAVPPDQVAEILSGYHLLLLPSRSENFGHVILEALRSGCLVMTSDKTPWRHLAEAGVGWDLSLGKPEEFGAALETLISMDDESFRARSRLAREYGQRFAEDPALVEANRQLFTQAWARWKGGSLGRGPGARPVHATSPDREAQVKR